MLKMSTGKFGEIVEIVCREILGEIADGVHDPHPLFCELSEIRFLSS